MKVSATKTSQRVERNIYLTSKGIKGYGQDNDYPQKILDIVNSSGTGKTCMDIYVKFIEGGGFLDETFGSTIINDRNEKVSSLLHKCSNDLRYFNGFACLVKYDGIGLPIEYYNIPFEHCRLEINQEREYTGRIAVYSDWTGQTGKAFRKDKVKFIRRFDPYSVQLQIAEAGGADNYPGQVFYFTSDGDFEYPICPFDPVITDMLTEEGISTVKHRNVRYNFLPAGILVRRGIKPRLNDQMQIDKNDPYNQEQLESRNMLMKMQGDNNACKIWVVDIDADEEKPEFIEFEAKNYDKQFEQTEQTVKENISGMFLIPPVLRGIDVGVGFGAELISQAYAFMNSVVDTERRMIETSFASMFEFYRTPFADFSINPLEYVSNVVTNSLP